MRGDRPAAPALEQALVPHQAEKQLHKGRDLIPEAQAIGVREPMGEVGGRILTIQMHRKF
jgi:hypothetical protein